jgi:molecular chaperone DnaK (HSP70)
MALRSVCETTSTSPSDNALTIPSSVANDQGSFTTPSFVSFTAEERLIGEAAKNQAAMNPINTVFDVK